MKAKPSQLKDEERLSRLQLLRSDGIGPATFHALLARYGRASEAIARWPSVMRRIRTSSEPRLFPRDDACRELDRIGAFGARLISHDEAGYPSALAAIASPPPLLTVKGNLELLWRDAIAVVGSRNASAIGSRFARDISRELGQFGWVTVSGLARGIDTAAHVGSLDTGTIAVMAGGIDVIYPPENSGLHADIATRGVLVSEVPFGQQPTAQHFPRRNRIISGLSLGVLVVEATLNSGSLITARLAAEQGREVFAVPGSPLDPRAKGTNALLRQGAILAENAEDISSNLQGSMSRQQALPSDRAQASEPSASPVREDDLEAEILGSLSTVPVEMDELVRLVGAPAAAVSGVILDLELAGLLTRHPGQRVSLGPRR